MTVIGKRSAAKHVLMYLSYRSFIRSYLVYSFMPYPEGPNVTPNETQAPPWPGFYAHAASKKRGIREQNNRTIT